MIIFVIKKHCLTPPPHPRLAGEASRTLKTNCVLANCQKHVLSRATVFVANALASMPSPVFGETRAKASILSVSRRIPRKGTSRLQSGITINCFSLPPHPSLRDTFSPRAKAFTRASIYTLADKVQISTNVATAQPPCFPLILEGVDGCEGRQQFADMRARAKDLRGHRLVLT